MRSKRDDVTLEKAITWQKDTLPSNECAIKVRETNGWQDTHSAVMAVGIVVASLGVAVLVAHCNHGNTLKQNQSPTCQIQDKGN
jgi:hypothetical protein